MSARRIDGQSGEYKEMAHTPTTGAKKYSISGVPDAAPVSLNYLLVMPRFVDKVGEWYQFPLGIPYVSSCMKAAGLNVYTLNMNHEEGTVGDTVQAYIKKYDIGMVLTGGLSFQYNAIKEIIAAAKAYDPHIVTAVGGGIITSAPEAGMVVLEYADYGIVGEGEETTPELCKVVAEQGDPLSVNGLIIAPHVLGEELRIHTSGVIDAPCRARKYAIWIRFRSPTMMVLTLAGSPVIWRICLESMRIMRLQ